jgi:lia operon protein LiaG
MQVPRVLLVACRANRERPVARCSLLRSGRGLLRRGRGRHASGCLRTGGKEQAASSEQRAASSRAVQTTAAAALSQRYDVRHSAVVDVSQQSTPEGTNQMAFSTSQADRSSLFVVAAACAAMCVPFVAGAQTAERHVVSGNIVGVYNLVGIMRVEGGTGSDVVVEVTKGGPDASKLRVETGPARGRSSLRVIYPSRRVLYRDGRWGWGSRTTVNVADDGTFYEDKEWGGTRVEIASRGDGLEAHADLRIQVPPGKRVAFFLAAGEATISNVDGDILLDVGAASVTTTHTKGSLTLDTGSGRVQVTDADGEVSLDTGSGSVELSNVRGPRLRLDAGSGGVRANGITVSKLDLDTGSGSVRLQSVKADDVVLDSGSGSIELGLVANVKSVKVDAGSGGITIGVPPDLGAAFEIETGSGGIDFDFPVQVRRKSRGYLSGTIGDGKGSIVIESGSGGVRFVKR